ncbi:hypothetical protein HGRIS_014546 [Hohenbuehelia grisea]|uniref:DUF6593 domain-containing protein n=1 Tax=Hohenbuehelia grisea TaxID=104357 RepID=A0ABR3JVR4_9AGAR
MSDGVSLLRRSLASPPPEYVPWVETTLRPHTSGGRRSAQSLFGTSRSSPVIDFTSEAALSEIPPPVPPHDRADSSPERDSRRERRGAREREFSSQLSSPEITIHVAEALEDSLSASSPETQHIRNATRPHGRTRSSPRSSPELQSHERSYPSPRLSPHSSPRATPHSPSIQDQLSQYAPSPASSFRQPTPEVVLRWSNDQEYTTVVAGPNEYALPIDDITPSDSPPVYAEAQRPTHAVKYTFSPTGANTMILVPPEVEPDSRPKYHISVSMDCFIPSLYITTIRRGGTEDGEVVGDFQIGEADQPETVFIRGKDWRIKEAFTRYGPSKAPRWIWGFRGRKLYWDCREDTKVCYDTTAKTKLYAKFTPKTSMRTRGQPVELASLEVFPDGQVLFDDILITALITERYRLTIKPKPT